MGQLVEFRDAKTGESLESRQFATRDEMVAYARTKYAGRPVEGRTVQKPEGNALQRGAFGVQQGVTGPVEGAGMVGSGLLAMIQKKMMGMSSEADPAAAMGGVARSIQGKNDAVASGLGIQTPNPEEADLAVSVGRGIGGVLYGARNLANLAGSVAGEAADYAIQKSGGGAVARFLGSVVGDVGATSAVSNPSGVAALARGVANKKGIRAYNNIRTLDIVGESFKDAIASGQTRTERMLKFSGEAWDKFDRAVKQGLNKQGTAFDPGGMLMVDATSLYKQANTIVTSTPKDMRKELPELITALAERGRKPETGQGSLMPLVELREYHKKINALWLEASHKNASPVSGARASKADELRGSIEAIYEQMLRPVAAERGMPNPARGAVLPQGKGNVQTDSGQLLTRDPSRPTENLTSPNGLNRDQASTLATALESSRQLGSEIDGLKKVGIDLARGDILEPAKLLDAVFGSNKRLDSPEIARDVLAIVEREGDPLARSALGQSWMDHVLGPGADFKVEAALKRLNQSREVGNLWAGPERVKNLEGIVRTLRDPKASDSARQWAKTTLSWGLGIIGAGAASGGDVPHGFIQSSLVAGAGMAASSIPHVAVYMRDKFGPEATQMFMRELLMDRTKYLRMEKIAKGFPKANDFEWVNTQVRALLMRQAGRGARQDQEKLQ